MPSEYISPPPQDSSPNFMQKIDLHENSSNLSYYVKKNLGEDFTKFCGLLRIYELYISPPHKTPLLQVLCKKIELHANSSNLSYYIKKKKKKIGRVGQTKKDVIKQAGFSKRDQMGPRQVGRSKKKQKTRDVINGRSLTLRIHLLVQLQPH